ncbi:MAG: hypothetical protein ACIALR_11055 [Blastopirellula sp. JB062]
MRHQIDRMTLIRFAAICVVQLVLGSALHAAAPKPIRGVITERVSDIFSGPGEDYYVCDFLEEGAEIEIYAEEENGWLAIRPPHGSFSWVLADALIATDKPNLMEASRDEAPCFIGSRLEERRDAAHVRLMRGEVVQTLGSAQSLNSETGLVEKWIKIAPPAGEFRWIKANTAEKVPVESATAATGSTGPQPKMNATAHGWSRRAADSPWSVDKPQPEIASRSPIAAEHQQVDAQVPVTPSLPPGPLNHAKSRAVAAVPGSMTFGASTVSGQAPAHMPNFSGNFAGAVQWLEAELTKTVSLPVDQWRLEALKSAAQQLRYEGATPLERGEALLLLEKIEQFAQLQTRKRAAAKVAAADSIDRSSVNVAATKLGEAEDGREGEADPIEIGVMIGDDEHDPRFDGEGWLMPVIKRASSAKNSARYTPPFALTDADGNVLQFVTPSPGINLRRYLKQKVGLYGQVAATEEFTRPHLTANRVVVLSRHEKQAQR